MVAFGVTLTVAILTGQADAPADELPGWMTAVSVTALWIPVLIGLRILSKRLGTGDFRADYGLHFRWVDLAGIPLGVLTQLVVLKLIWPLRSWFPDQFHKDAVEEPARNLFDRLNGAWLVLLVFIVVVGAPVIEELLYRGLIFRTLDGLIAPPLAVLGSALSTRLRTPDGPVRRPLRDRHRARHLCTAHRPARDEHLRPRRLQCDHGAGAPARVTGHAAPAMER